MSNNGLKQFCKQHEMSRLGEDMCYVQRKDYDSRRQYELNTYHYHPYGAKVVATCYPGQFPKDGYGIGGQNVDADSCVKIHPGNIMTKARNIQNLPAFNIQMPQIKGYFDADTESNLRPEIDYGNFNACTLNTEKSFMPYSFQYFNHLCYDPQDPMYIIEENTFNQSFPNARLYHRAGEDTRHDRQEKYRNGCDWRTKNYPPNLSYSIFGN